MDPCAMSVGMEEHWGVGAMAPSVLQALRDDPLERHGRQDLRQVSRSVTLSPRFPVVQIALFPHPFLRLQQASRSCGQMQGWEGPTSLPLRSGRQVLCLVSELPVWRRAATGPSAPPGVHACSQVCMP